MKRSFGTDINAYSERPLTELVLTQKVSEGCKAHTCKIPCHLMNTKGHTVSSGTAASRAVKAYLIVDTDNHTTPLKGTIPSLCLLCSRAIIKNACLIMSNIQLYSVPAQLS